MSKEKLQKIIQRATTDFDFRKRLIQEPREVLMDEGFSIPPEKKVVIVESTDDMFYVVLSTPEKEKKAEPQPLEYTIEDNVVHLKGRLDSYTVEQVREIFLDWEKDISFELKDLTYISSAGLSFFLRIHKQLDQSGHKMSLMNMQPAVRNVFVLGGFDKIFNI
jgi:anti-sigma B factor antagonist